MAHKKPSPAHACDRCGKPWNGKNKYCSHDCWRDAIRGVGKQTREHTTDNASRINRLMELDEMLWRASTPWDRERIKAAMEIVKKEMVHQ